MRGARLGRIERLDTRFGSLVPADAPPEVLHDFAPVEGPHWLEGPAWDKGNGRLFFSDVKANAIYSWDESGGVRLFMQPSGFRRGGPPYPMEEPGSNGLAFDEEGRLLICEHGERCISRIEADGSRTVLADRYQGERLNSPNDLVCRSNGDLYFTDPAYGLPRRLEDPGRELDVCGVFRLTAAGELTLLLDHLSAPNGIGFSPDEKTLYVTDSGTERPAWWAFPVREDGTPGEGRVLFEPTGLLGLGGPDGLVVDHRGNIFGAGLERVFVFSEDGTHLGSIYTDGLTSNVAWGEDGATLFITTERRLLRLRTGTRGPGFLWPLGDR